MNNAGGALNFNAVLNMKDWNNGIAQMKRDLTGLGSVTQSQTAQMDSAFKNLSIGIAGYLSVGTLKNFAMELINVRGEFQKTEIAFSSMLGSVGKAKQLMGQMVDLAAKTPFSLQDVSAGAKQLLAFQVPANQVVDILTRMGNIAAGLGVPLSRINLVYGQVKAKGKLMGDDLRQFSEAGIPMIAELAKKFGKTTGEIQSMVSAGKIGFKDVQDVLFNLTNEGGMFYNLMEKQSASLSGKIVNLGDAWDQMLNKIGESNEGLIYSSIQGLTYLVDNYKDVARTLLELIAAYGIYKAAVVATSVISAAYNKTIASEIALLSFSDKMRLGRAMVTQRQAEATARDTVSELASVRAKYTSLQAEVSLLAVKKQAAIQSGVTASAKAQEARLQLTLAQAELRSIQATGTAREIELAQKRVTTAQNTVIASQESASIARKRALAAATEFNASKQQLENTAQAVGIAEKTAASAAEAAQVAAKNANSIATTRLTFLQTLQTIAAQGAARAQAFLNETILANPYALATVLLSAMIYAIYKQTNALTALEEIQQKYKEQLSQSNITVNEQVTKLNSLISVIKKQNTSYDDASKILKQVNTLTNNRIEGLTVEAIKTGKADAAIKAYTETLYKQAEAMLKVQEIAKLEEERKSLLDDLKNVSISEKFNATFNPFNDNYYKDGWQGAKEERLKAIEKTLSDYKKDVQKAVKDGLDLSGTTIEAEPPNIKLGIIESLNEQLKQANENIEKAGTRAEIEKWKKIRDKIQAKLDSYDLKKKPKEKQLAEIFPNDSIKDLEQKAQLITDALQTVENGIVRLRKLDKFGKDKDEKGNPFYTGENVSQEEAVRRLKEINTRLAEKRQEIEAKSFEDEINEVKRQFEVRDRLLKSGYSKEVVDEMFPKVKDKSFVQYLSETGQALDRINNKSSAENLIKLQDILNEYTGEASFIERVNKQIDELKAKFKGDELIDKLEKFRAANLEGTTGDDKNSKSILIKKAIEEELDRQKTAYRSLLEEHKSFSERKIQIEKETAVALKKISDDPNLNPDQKKGYSGKVDRKSKEDISQLAIDELTKSKEWMSLYGNIDELTEYQMNILLKELESRKGQLAKVLTPVDFSILLKNFREVKEKISEENPFLGLFNSLQELFTSFGEKSEEAGQQAYSGFEKATEGVKGTLKATKGIIASLAPAREYMSDAANDALDTIEQVTTMGLVMMQAIQSTVKAVKTALNKASWSNWITAIISIIYTVIKAIVSLFSWIAGNKTKRINAEIKAWQLSVDQLKNSYEDLQRTIEKTAGEAQLTMQRELISNLREQQRILEQMRVAESKKKKADQDKIASYNNQIHEINTQIQQVVEDFKLSILGVDFKDFAQKLSDALVDAFGKGEDAALSFEKVANDVMKDAVINALKIKFLQPVADDFVKKLYASMGFGSNEKLEEQKTALDNYKKALAEIQEKLKGASILSAGPLESLKKYYEELIAKVNAEIAAGEMSGAFDGLSDEEIKVLQNDYKNDPRIKGFLEGIKNINELFDTTIEGAQGLKGDIKGITEKTAGALEGQINAMRINVAEALKIHRENQNIFKNQLLQLTQIEINTRPLKGIYDQIKELNSKVKNNLAGVP